MNESGVQPANRHFRDPTPPDGGEEAPEATAADSRWLAAISDPPIAIPLLLALGALLFLVNLGGYPLYTKGEPREATSVLALLRAHSIRDLILPMRAGVEIPSKPLLMHWLAAIVSLLAGGRIDEWTVRLPSALFAIAGMLACYLYVRRLFDPISALLAAMILGATFQYLQAGSGARVDMTLTFFMELAFFEFLMIAEGLTARRSLFYLAMALAALAKGPIGVALPIVTAACWIAIERRWDLFARLSLVRGALIVTILAGGWYAAATIVGGAGFLRKHLLAENLYTFLHNPIYSGGHDHPFYYVELALLAGFLPWSIFIPSAVAHAPRQWRSDSRLRYLIVWFAVVLIFYNLAHSKRGVYLLALYPALATIVALRITALARDRANPRWVSIMSRSVAVAFVAIAVAALDELIVLLISERAVASMFRLFDWTAPAFVPALAAAVRDHLLIAIALPLALAALGLMIYRARPKIDALAASLVLGCAAVALAANLFVVPAIANTLTLKQFALDARRIIATDSAGYLDGLNYDVAFYTAMTIPIVSSADALNPDATAPRYLICGRSLFDALPAAARSRFDVILTSGPTELDGRGGIVLLRRKT